MDLGRQCRRMVAGMVSHMGPSYSQSATTFQKWSSRTVRDHPQHETLRMQQMSRTAKTINACSRAMICQALHMHQQSKSTHNAENTHDTTQVPIDWPTNLHGQQVECLLPILKHGQ